MTVSPGLTRPALTDCVRLRATGLMSAKLKFAEADEVEVRSIPVNAPVAVEAAAGVPFCSVPRTNPVFGVSAIE